MSHYYTRCFITITIHGVTKLPDSNDPSDLRLEIHVEFNKILCQSLFLFFYYN